MGMHPHEQRGGVPRGSGREARRHEDSADDGTQPSRGVDEAARDGRGVGREALSVEEEKGGKRANEEEQAEAVQRHGSPTVACGSISIRVKEIAEPSGQPDWTSEYTRPRRRIFAPLAPENEYTSLR